MRLSFRGKDVVAAVAREVRAFRASRWRLEIGSADAEGTIATFSLGRLLDTGRLILLFEAKQVSGGTLARRVDLYLRARRSRTA